RGRACREAGSPVSRARGTETGDLGASHSRSRGAGGHRGRRGEPRLRRRRGEAGATLGIADRLRVALTTCPRAAPVVRATAMADATPQRAVDPRIRGRMPALDGVRGLAILMVLFVHFFADTVATNRFERVLTRVSGFGTYGVDLFFMLSG